MENIFDAIISEEELARWLNTSCPTLQRQRFDGSGPPFIQLSQRRIGYRKSAVERWLATRTISRVGTFVPPGSNPKVGVTAAVTSISGHANVPVGAKENHNDASPLPVGPSRRTRA